jgi:hypothetical protein
MRIFSLSALALLVALCPIFAGCGGEAVTGPVIIGFYSGQTDGDGQGLIKFFATVTGALRGNMTLVPLCGQEINISGTVAPSGAVSFSGSACGVDFTGTGLIQLNPTGQRYTGSGTWTGSNGTNGTWSVDWQGRTGSISCPI